LDHYPIVKAIKEKVIIEGEEMIIERPDGTRKSVLSHPAPVFDANGILTGFINTLIDTTDQKSSEENKARLADIVES